MKLFPNANIRRYFYRRLKDMYTFQSSSPKVIFFLFTSNFINLPSIPIPLLEKLLYFQFRHLFGPNNFIEIKRTRGQINKRVHFHIIVSTTVDFPVGRKHHSFPHQFKRLIKKVKLGSFFHMYKVNQMSSKRDLYCALYYVIVEQNKKGQKNH